MLDFTSSRFPHPLSLNFPPPPLSLTRVIRVFEDVGPLHSSPRTRTISRRPRLCRRGSAPPGRHCGECHAYLNGRFLDGWAEASGVQQWPGRQDWESWVEWARVSWVRGKGEWGKSGKGKMRVVRPKGVVVELPRTAKDLGERIDLPGRGWSYMRGETEHFDKSVEAMHKVVEHVELAYSNGDHELGIEGDLVKALNTLGKRLVYGRVTEQVAENQTLGLDYKVDEWGGRTTFKRAEKAPA
ncbi:hypothetical protein EHS25_005669 [Saitozyma podzolica]|uniref:Uncharacterized protein n=1 Tax=Saitozyma podzolica TaxID=1890683 RepID=A0A427XVU3_9TREE|nr:hypothetical protein EHS25_005669 [Saitozyma podzolica]